jgi:hypothetical protein
VRADGRDLFDLHVRRDDVSDGVTVAKDDVEDAGGKAGLCEEGGGAKGGGAKGGERGELGRLHHNCVRGGEW